MEAGGEDQFEDDTEPIFSLAKDMVTNDKKQQKKYHCLYLKLNLHVTVDQDLL